MLLLVPERRASLTQKRRLPHLPTGIAVRLFALSWLISTLTLAIFVAAIIPEQKRDLEGALASKARGISSSLQEVTAGAAISEDYSSVVDQCAQVLSGDEAIDYLVVTKNDGVSVIVERNKWRTATLDSSWRPLDREAFSRIEFVPLLGRRVFHFGRPFDYSAIQWGWIHVGLSLEAFDQSVARVYRRTGALTLCCLALSLLISAVYAKRQVRPILSLQSAVRQIAQGDLSARSEIRTGDEIESLAQSFNAMAASLLQRNHILETVRFSAQEFLTATDLQAVIGDVLGRMGAAAQASHGYVLECRREDDGRWSARAVHHWAAHGFPGVTEDQSCRFSASVLAKEAERLNRGEIVCGAANAAPCGQSSNEPLVRSFIWVPVHVGGEWYGVLALGDRRQAREWSEAERDSIHAIAGMMGASIGRQRAQDALIEANETLEVRVAERTRELQEQVNAKQRALAELADAQQRLLDLSRQSGMAEIATGVLHNVGNVLTSLNVSTTIVANKVAELRADNLCAAIEILRDHAHELTEFVSTDPKGSRILPYMAKLGRHIRDERQAILGELNLLRDHVGHIKEIVATQQNYARVSGLIEDVSLATLVEDAFCIIQSGFDRHHIRVERDFEPLPPIPADKHKILQILLNLLRNAKQAIKESGNSDRLIRVSIRQSGSHTVRIEVKDSGIGLSRENLTRIFAHGFTTKRDGHGFGLHSGALAAREMGGALWAESDGPGCGATFVLELPCDPSVSLERSVA
jgi:signal transduction histidine kinase